MEAADATVTQRWPVVHHLPVRVPVDPLDQWRRDFYSRVGGTYAVTLLVRASILALIDRQELFVDMGFAIKRTVLVAFPVSFSAAVADSLT